MKIDIPITDVAFEEYCDLCDNFGRAECWRCDQDGMADSYAGKTEVKVPCDECHRTKKIVCRRCKGTKSVTTEAGEHLIEFLRSRGVNIAESRG